MPTYDYCCKQCGLEFEVQHAMTAPLPTCRHCGGAVRRLILSAPAVHGQMAQGREKAARTLEPTPAPTGHGPGCPCCH